MFDFVKSDLCRYVGKDNLNLKNFIKHYLFNSGFKYSFWLRLGTHSKNRLLRFIARLQHYRLSSKYQLDIPIGTNIGYGLYIGHGMSVVVNKTSVIGNNVNLSQFTSIGSNNGKAASIGDNVYIGPNVCIVGNVTIASNVKIGAGAVITKSLCKNVTAAGVPAKVISIDETPNPFVNRRW
ncbi:serine O-acetyltransferase [Vibrio cyclitrophicus]|uniref:serine O-acetyltransferase n=1 Tax=Vibrio cyclitrophicus TaxID=47951 RepID=UPI000375B65D|nr:serine O-acetyltransferase [Vibrio cyclitrophicus]OEF29291.1 serine acetyltransferase [Vibrio cyclitrophicus 1F97]